MNATVYIALLAWPALMLPLFLVLHPRRAVITTFVLGWRVLPVASIELPGIPDLSKAMSVSATALIGAVLFDARRLMSFRPGGEVLRRHVR